MIDTLKAWLRRRSRIVAGVAAALVLVTGTVAYLSGYRRVPPPVFESDEDHFLFGSIGAETQTGVPYWIWLVLPRMFPEYLPAPGGYPTLGILWKEGQELPVGFSRVTVGYPRVAINCAMCHTTGEQAHPSVPPTVTTTRAGHRDTVQQYLKFLVACASDARFSASSILAEIARNHELSAFERLYYRFVVIPQTRRRLLALQEVDGLLDGNVDWVSHDFIKWSTNMSNLRRAQSHLE
jgi:hypothetical protein